MTSSMFTLNWRDFFKGLILAVAVPVLVTIQTSLAAGNITFDWKAIGISALATLVAYLLKNFLTDDVKQAEKVIVEAKQKEIEQQQSPK